MGRCVELFCECWVDSVSVVASKLTRRTRWRALGRRCTDGQNVAMPIRGLDLVGHKRSTAIVKF